MGHKLWMSLVLVLVLGGVAAGGYLYYEGQQQPPRYLTAAVERGAIATTVNATGVVNAVTTVQVGSQVSGTIQKLFVDFNSPVKEGEIIAQIDPAPLSTKVAQARANVASALAAVQVAQATTINAKAAVETAQANAESARANIEKSKVALADARRILERNKEMARKSLIAQNELDTAQAAYDGAVAQLKASEAQLEAATGQLKSASAQQRLAAAQETGRCRPGRPDKSGVAGGRAGPRTHHHPCPGQWYCRLPERRRWPDCGGEFAGADSLSHRSGSHADAGRYERQ